MYVAFVSRFFTLPMVLPCEVFQDTRSPTLGFVAMFVPRCWLIEDWQTRRVDAVQTSCLQVVTRQSRGPKCDLTSSEPLRFCASRECRRNSATAGVQTRS